jgi:hypothetical protein
MLMLVVRAVLASSKTAYIAESLTDAETISHCRLYSGQ